MKKATSKLQTRDSVTLSRGATASRVGLGRQRRVQTRLLRLRGALAGPRVSVKSAPARSSVSDIVSKIRICLGALN